MKIYTLIGGVNGTGKSSLTGALKAERNDLGIMIDVDKMAAEGNFTSFEAGKAAIRKINECLGREVSFTQESTLSGYKTERTVKKARDKGYYIRLYYIGLDTFDECLKRIENRVAKGGHNVQTDDVVRRFDNRFDSLVKILPYCDEATLFDNHNGFAEIAEYKNGEIISKGDQPPQWLVELIATLKNQ